MGILWYFNLVLLSCIAMQVSFLDPECRVSLAINLLSHHLPNRVFLMLAVVWHTPDHLQPIKLERSVWVHFELQKELSVQVSQVPNLSRVICKIVQGPISVGGSYFGSGTFQLIGRCGSRSMGSLTRLYG
jgi:hypothetical protein